MYTCKYCGKEFETKQKMSGHVGRCAKNPNYSEEKMKKDLEKARKLRNSKIRTKDTHEYTCQYCGKVCIGKNSLNNHEIRCNKNPNKIQFVSNFIKYNEQLKTGKVIKYYKNHYDKANKLGKDKPLLSAESRKKISDYQKSKTVSDEVRNKISNTQKNNYKGKSRWYTQIQHRLSYAEQYFFNIFPNSAKHYHVNRYFLDIAYPDNKIYIEIDGEQHKNDPKVVAHDIERTQILDDLGWILLCRIYWPDYSKLSNNERKEFVDKILKKLEELNIKP